VEKVEVALFENVEVVATLAVFENTKGVNEEEEELCWVDEVDVVSSTLEVDVPCTEVLELIGALVVGAADVRLLDGEVEVGAADARLLDDEVEDAGTDVEVGVRVGVVVEVGVGVDEATKTLELAAPPKPRTC
jgi:hypothetical protein